MTFEVTAKQGVALSKKPRPTKEQRQEAALEWHDGETR